MSLFSRNDYSQMTPAMNAAGVAQIYNLPYCRITFGRPSQLRAAGGLQIRDTAECNSALRSLESVSRREISGPGVGLTTFLQNFDPRLTSRGRRAG
jgi:hypothetical protein